MDEDDGSTVGESVSGELRPGRSASFENDPSGSIAS